MFDGLKELRVKTGALQAQFVVLLERTKGHVAAGDPVQPGQRVPQRAPGEPPPPARPPVRNAAFYKRPRPQGETAPYNPPMGFQSPAPPAAPRLPPPPPPPTDPSAARRLVLEYIGDLRAAAIHLHNSAQILVAISELLERAIANTPSPPRRR